MEKVIINSYEEFEKLVGQQIGVSDYCSRLSDAFHASLPVESDYSGEQSENDDQLRDG